MSIKAASSKTSTRTVCRVKVVTNRPKSGGLASLNSIGTALIVAFVFMLIGVATIAWVRAATTTHTLWSTSTVPKMITVTETSSVELGVRFQAAYSGQVTGVRFYKGPQNTGTHRGNLWSTDGR